MAHRVATATVKDVQWGQWVAPLALFLIGLGFYSINLDQPPRFDELYYFLGARGCPEHGEPRIAECVYERARYFTAILSRDGRRFRHRAGGAADQPWPRSPAGSRATAMLSHFSSSFRTSARASPGSP
jgi:hypothetical protein